MRCRRPVTLSAVGPPASPRGTELCYHCAVCGRVAPESWCHPSPRRHLPMALGNRMASYKNAERKLLLRQYGHLYQRVDAPRDKCVYCGDSASTLDHCPPLSSAPLWDRRPTSRPRFLLAPSCAECNLILGDRHLVTLTERVEFIFRRLTSKYEKAFALWPEEDIREMSPEFQISIRARKRGLTLLLGRVRHAELCALNGIDDLFLA